MAQAQAPSQQPTMNVLITLLFSLPLQSISFSPAARIPLYHGVTSNPLRPTIAAIVDCSVPTRTSPLSAKKRRRRKVASPSPTTPSDDLPDFDDDEEEIADEPAVSKAEAPAKPSPATPPPPAKSVTPVRRGAGLNAKLAEEVGGNVDGLDEDTILEAMRGKAGGGSWQPPRTIEDTLGDRSLEKFMDFDRMIEQDRAEGSEGSEGPMDLPDFDEVIARRKRREAAEAVQEGRVEDAAMLIDTEGMGKKAARNAQRRAVAMQREAEMEDEVNPFEGVNILKLLENGAWVGIGLLVLWEIYINSPFFERAAPLIPVVYDQATPPGM